MNIVAIHGCRWTGRLGKNEALTGNKSSWEEARRGRRREAKMYVIK